MINVYSPSAIRAAEADYITSAPESELIERASEALFEELPLAGEYIVFAGSGNNGSDGLSVALRIKKAHGNVRVYLFGEGKTPDNIRLRKETEEAGIPVKKVSSAEDIVTDPDSCIIDAMIGIGNDRPLSGLYAEAAEKINSTGAFVVSADIPTGLGAGTGSAGTAVKASRTVTFSGAKPGLYLGSGKNFCGEIVIKDIGIPMPSPDSVILEESDITLKKRLPASHKGNYPNVKIIAGSPEMMGASLLAHESALSALRGGAGYATLCVPKSLATVYQTRVMEEMLMFLPDDGGRIIFDGEVFSKLLSSSAVVLGPGLGRNPEILKIIRYLSLNYTGILIIDADGLNVLSEDLSALEGHVPGVVLTSHIGEFRRLSRISEPTPEDADSFARRLNCVVALKSASTYITDGKNSYINTTGTPAMAKGGSGDVLSGLIGALADKGGLLLSVAKACFAFGKAGEKAADRIGTYSVLASDITNILREEAANGKV